MLIPRYRPTQFEMMPDVPATGREEAAFSDLSKLWSRKGKQRPLQEDTLRAANEGQLNEM